MIKHILINLLFAGLLYLLIKPLIIKLESEDDIDAPKDFALETDQFDLNRIKAEVNDEVDIPTDFNILDHEHLNEISKEVLDGNYL